MNDALPGTMDRFSWAIAKWEKQVAEKCLYQKWLAEAGKCWECFLDESWWNQAEKAKKKT